MVLAETGMTSGGEVMASVDDVAAAILKRTGPIDTFKLQKLAYYCQAWHLVWESKPLFEAEIQAWANGPVVPDLYRKHRGRYTVNEWPHGDPAALSADERSSVDAVVKFYKKYKGYELAELTHREAPWRDARASAGLGPGERGSVTIDPEHMRIYYEGLIGTSGTTTA
jgi:uncharacterized phage-associated protein